MPPAQASQLRRDGVAALSPILVAIVLPALDLSERNLQILGLHASQFTALGAIAATVLIAALVFALLRHTHPAIEFLFSAYLFLGPLWIAQVLAGPWIGKSAAFVGMLGLAFACAALLLRTHRRQDILSFGSAVFAIGLLVSAVSNANSLREEAEDWLEKDRLAFGSNHDVGASFETKKKALPDIYHLVFDEFQTELFEAVATPGQLKSLSGFTFFPEATSPFGRTDMALGAIFSGRPYTFRGEPYAYIEEAFNGDQSFLTTLKNCGYHTTGIVHQVYPTKSPTPFHHTHQHIRYADYGGITNQSGLFRSLWIVSSFPNFFVEQFVPADQLDSLRSQTLLPATYGYFSVLSLRRYINNPKAWVSSAPRYVYAHMIVPHIPAVLDEQCVEQKEGKATISTHTACAINLATEFINVLKEQGRFKDALIVIHGDHGAQYTRDGKNLSLVRSQSKIQWHVGRSRALVLVKPAGGDDSLPLQRDPRQTDLYDLYPTILEAAGAREATGAPAAPGAIGQSLTAPPTFSRNRYYHFYEKSTDQRELIKGDLARYLVTQTGLTFERVVEIER